MCEAKEGLQFLNYIFTLELDTVFYIASWIAIARAIIKFLETELSYTMLDMGTKYDN